MNRPQQLNEAQRAYFALLMEVRANNMNGERIVGDLWDNTDLWERVIPFFDGDIKEFKQRELLGGGAYIDTLYILPPVLPDGSIEHEVKKRLYSVAKGWRADAITWETGGPQKRRYLKVWFD